MTRYGVRRAAAIAGGLVAGALLILALPGPASADPESDRAGFRSFFQQRFPDVPAEAWMDGMYAIDEGARQQWQEIEDFPPYEFTVEEGQALFQDPFGDGRSYGDCFPDAGSGIRQRYPRFDSETGEVETLEVAINSCRTRHGEPALPYDSTEMLALTSWIAYASRGRSLAIEVPDDPRALAAYEEGKRFFYTKRGRLNLACVDCHGRYAGAFIRGDHLSASLGHPTHFPVYRLKLGGMVSLHKRFHGCIRDVGAEPFEEQSSEYRRLEYFLTYMSNGLEANGPAVRK
jgi:sulfur-oxidizing protein SoxA